MAMTSASSASTSQQPGPAQAAGWSPPAMSFRLFETQIDRICHGSQGPFRSRIDFYTKHGGFSMQTATITKE
jgi:hypothetical protein